MGERGSSLWLLVVTSATPWDVRDKDAIPEEVRAKGGERFPKTWFLPLVAERVWMATGNSLGAFNDYKWFEFMNIVQKYLRVTLPVFSEPYHDRLIALSIIFLGRCLAGTTLARAGASFPLSWIWAGLWLTLNRRVGQKGQCVNSKPRPPALGEPQASLRRTRAMWKTAPEPQIAACQDMQAEPLSPPASGHRGTREPSKGRKDHLRERSLG